MLTVIRMLEQNSYDSISGLTVIEADPRICSGSQHTLIKPNRFLPFSAISPCKSCRAR